MSGSSIAGANRRRFIQGLSLSGGVMLAARSPVASSHVNAMDEPTFLRYIAHFNVKEYAGFASYYAPDVKLTYPGGRTVVGPAAIVDRYKTLHAAVNESLELHDLMFDGDRIFCSMFTVFSAFKDYPSFKYGEFDGLRAGQVAKMTNFVLYTMKNGKFQDIRIAHHVMHNTPDAP